MRDWLLTLALCACSKDAASPAPTPASPPASRDHTPAPTGRTAASAPAPAQRAYPDLGTALIATIPADTRVIGFGELHTRTDRPPATSALARFTRALPALADRLSDLVVETWLVDPACGQTGARATARIETAVKRPPATQSEIAALADAARAARVQPHAMTLTCADYATMAPARRDVDPEAMLSITTRELRRIATSAVAHRDREPQHRPWIAVYGGALHNDRFPAPSVAEWSYAAEVDRATGGHFVEIDLIAPELARADAVMQREPWFPLIDAPRDPANPVVVWTRGERSFVVVLP